MSKEERRKRIFDQQSCFNKEIDSLIRRLNNIPLAEGIDKNSWLYAGCIEDLEKARTHILNYIERVLK